MGAGSVPGLPPELLAAQSLAAPSPTASRDTTDRGPITPGPRITRLDRGMQSPTACSGSGLTTPTVALISDLTAYAIHAHERVGSSIPAPNLKPRSQIASPMALVRYA